LTEDPLGVMTADETTLIAGGGSQTNSNRWGDYSMMAVDPVDDCTFWYTQEYYQVTSAVDWRTRIGAFRFPNCTAAEMGTLTGVVYEAGGSPTSTPIPGAQVTAQAESQTHQATTNHEGAWTLLLPVDAYTVTAEAFGYHPRTLTNVGVTTNTTTTQLISLTAMTRYVVSGTATDAEAGWPLYAKINVATQDFASLLQHDVWTAPATGFYSLTLPAGVYTLYVQSWITGYISTHTQISPLMADQTRNIQLQADRQLCNAPGYERSEATAECERHGGGLVIGNVYDDNTDLPLNAVTVTHASGTTARTMATPDDASLDPGFYILFSPTGTHTITATGIAKGDLPPPQPTFAAEPATIRAATTEADDLTQPRRYGLISATVTVTPSRVTSQNLRLPAGWLTYQTQPGSQTGYAAEVQQGMSTTLPLTLTNLGGWPARFELAFTTPLVSVREENTGGYGLTEPGVYITVPKSTRMGGFTETATALRAPFRYPAGIQYNDPVRISPPDVVTPTDVLLLHADVGATVLRAMLNGYPDIGRTDVWTVTEVIPTLADVRAYDVVITWSNYPYADPDALGDLLADYADAGGHVIVMPFAMSQGQRRLGGRFVKENYLPLRSTGAGNHFATAWFRSSEAGDSASSPPLAIQHHPILQGVKSVSDYFRDVVTLTPGGHWIATWDTGVLTPRPEAFIATKGPVVALNAYGGDGYQWSGDFGIVIHNAINYVRTTTQDVAWVQATPVTETIPGCSRDARFCFATPITLTLDAGAPEINQPGVYQARLLVHNDTPYLLDALPITMTVFKLEAAIAATPRALSVTMSLDDTRSRTLSLHNTGTTPLTWNLTPPSNTPWLSLGLNTSLLPGVVPPGYQHVIDVTFDTHDLILSPMGDVDPYLTYTTTLTVTSDDPDNPILNVPVTLTVKLPHLTVSTRSLSETLHPAMTVTRTLRISNTGSGTLTWQITQTQETAWLTVVNRALFQPTLTPPMSHTQAAVVISSKSLDPVTKQNLTSLHIMSNDPREPDVQITVRLTVTPFDIYLPLVTRTD